MTSTARFRNYTFIVSFLLFDSWYVSRWGMRPARLFSEFKKPRTGRRIEEARASATTSEKIRGAERVLPENKLITAEIMRAGKAGNWDDAYAAFWSAESKNTILFNAIISVANRCGRWEKALTLFREMCELRLEKTPPTYCLIIQILGKLGRYSEAKALWQEHKEYGLSSEPRERIIAYQNIIDAAAGVGNVDEASLLFHAALKDGIHPDPQLFGVVIKACKAAQNATMANYYLREMRKMSCSPDAYTYTAAMSAHLYASLSEIQALESEMNIMDIQTTSAFVDAYVSSICGTAFKTDLRSDLSEAVQVISNLSDERVQALRDVIMSARHRGCQLNQLTKRVDRVLQNIDSQINVCADELVTALGLTFNRFPPGGVHVKSVLPGSWADEQGVSKGNLILKVNAKEVATLDVVEFKVAMQIRPLQISFVK